MPDATAASCIARPTPAIHKPHVLYIIYCGLLTKQPAIATYRPAQPGDGLSSDLACLLEWMYGGWTNNKSINELTWLLGNQTSVYMYVHTYIHSADSQPAVVGFVSTCMHVRDGEDGAVSLISCQCKFQCIKRPVHACRVHSDKNAAINAASNMYLD
jgi:hypothetical protein